MNEQLLIHTPVQEIWDTDIQALCEELEDLRSGRFADYTGNPLLNYLTAFFLPDDQRRFVPIGRANVCSEYWLLRRYSDCRGSSVAQMLRELERIAGIHVDSASGQKIYTVLNSLMRPICKGQVRQKGR